MPWWAVVIIVLLLLALAVRVLAEVAFRAGFTWDRDVSKTEKINIDRIRRSPHPEGAAKVLAGRDWLLARESREVEITSFDGLRLRGRLYPCDSSLAGKENCPVLLLAHGFRSYGAFDFSCGCPFYMELGFDLLLIDHRAHGRSEGRYICFGANEGRDVADWCRWLDKEYPGRPVVLGGISMGATSVLAAAGRAAKRPRRGGGLRLHRLQRRIQPRAAPAAPALPPHHGHSGAPVPQTTGLRFPPLQHGGRGGENEPARHLLPRRAGRLRAAGQFPPRLRRLRLGR